MTAYSKENAKFPEPSEFNRRLDKCPDIQTKHGRWIVVEWVCLLVATVAGALLFAGLMQLMEGF